LGSCVRKTVIKKVKTGLVSEGESKKKIKGESGANRPARNEMSEAAVRGLAARPSNDKDAKDQAENPGRGKRCSKTEQRAPVR